jgi:hypothetical protein
MNTTHAGMMLQSTNDSRIHEMLPNVGGNQAQQQKQNMFNQTRGSSFASGNNQTKITTGPGAP